MPQFTSVETNVAVSQCPASCRLLPLSQDGVSKKLQSADIRKCFLSMLSPLGTPVKCLPGGSTEASHPSARGPTARLDGLRAWLYLPHRWTQGPHAGGRTRRSRLAQVKGAATWALGGGGCAETDSPAASEQRRAAPSSAEQRRTCDAAGGISHHVGRDRGRERRSTV